MMKDRSFIISTLVVLFAHSALFSWFFFSEFLNQPPIIPKKCLVIETIQLQPNIDQLIAAVESVSLQEKVEQTLEIEPEKNPVTEIKNKSASVSASESEAKPKPKPKSEPNLEVKAKPKPKSEPNLEVKAKPKPKPEPKSKTKLAQSNSVAKTESTPSKKEMLLAKAKRSIAKIDQSHVKIAANSSQAISKVGSLQIDALSVDEIGYRDELAEQLKKQLTFPEEGEVELKLTLTRFGKVVKVEVLGGNSIKNQRYLESALPALSFPNFGNHFKDSKQYTFLLTLTNE